MLGTISRYRSWIITFSDLGFFNDTATTEIYTYLHTLSLHDALPISVRAERLLRPVRALSRRPRHPQRQRRPPPLQRAQHPRPPPELPARPAARAAGRTAGARAERSEEHTSELQSLMRISYAVFCLKKKKKTTKPTNTTTRTTVHYKHSRPIT